MLTVCLQAHVCEVKGAYLTDQNRNVLIQGYDSVIRNTANVDYWYYWYHSNMEYFFQHMFSLMKITQLPQSCLFVNGQVDAMLIC